MPPALGAGCSLTGATLRLFLNTTGGARQIDAYKASSSWSETTVTWNTQPSTTGTPASATSGAAATWMTWDVLSIVQAIYSGTNNGFLLKDSTKPRATSRRATTAARPRTEPELVLTVG